MTGPGPDDEWLDPRELDAEPQRGLPWPWLLALLAALAWYPLEPFWQSDDFIALEYARDFRNTLADFFNPQYGATDLWWFYRPLITLSFWVDAQLSGADPFLPHLVNAAAHGINAMLLGLVWSRFLPPASAWAAGLLWGLSPAHAGAILWTVGRVDVFATSWSLLSLWLFLRWWEGEQRSRLPSLAAFGLALGCKEVAFVVPGLVVLLGLGLAREDRFRGALRAAWPHFAALALFLLWRGFALGVFVGGYAGFALDPGAAVTGLGNSVLWLLDPMLYAGADAQARWLGGPLSPSVAWLGLLPAAAALVAVCAQRRFGLVALSWLAFLGLCLPVLPFWMAADDVKNLRYYYLPLAALAGLLAAGGPVVWGLALLVWITPLWDLRSEYQTFHRQLATLHRQLVDDVAGEDPQLLFVDGLPRHSPNGNVVGFHHGVDRVLEPPFGDGRHRVFALRPLFDHPSAYRLRQFEDDERQIALPEGITLVFEGPTILQRRIQPNPLPDLRVRLDAPERFTAGWMRRLAAGEVGGALVMEGVRSTHYRITVFTAGGYLAVVAPDRGEAGEADGRVELGNLFREDGRYARQPGSLLTIALPIPVTMDLEPRFPVLIEAGSTIDVGGTDFFAPSHSARRFLWIDFDRDFSAFVREALGR